MFERLNYYALAGQVRALVRLAVEQPRSIVPEVTLARIPVIGPLLFHPPLDRFFGGDAVDRQDRHSGS